MKNWLLPLLFLCLWLPTPAQQTLPAEVFDSIHTYEDTLGYLSYVVVNDSLPENRFAACRKLIPTLVKALQFPNSFRYPFERLRAISILYPRDSSFRIFTWQLMVNPGEYRYYGAIQMNSPELQLFPLIDRSFEVDNPEQAVLPHDRWYGALYYNIKSFESPQGPMHLLFGYDGNSLFERRKLVDVLHFREGKPFFGAPVFLNPDGAPRTRNRILLEYAAEATIRLNYDPALDLLIFDHLIPLATEHGPSFVPDGSYEAYRLQDGLWHYIPKVFHQTLDEAPRDFPILDQRKNIDIFGRKKG